MSACVDAVDELYNSGFIGGKEYAIDNLDITYANSQGSGTITKAGYYIFSSSQTVDTKGLTVYVQCKVTHKGVQQTLYFASGTTTASAISRATWLDVGDTIDVIGGWSDEGWSYGSSNSICINVK